MTWRAVLCLGLVFGSCRCTPRVVDPVELGFTVEPESLDFGRVLRGKTKRLTLTLTSVTRAPVSVAVRAPAPFSAAELVEVPGGAQASLEVTFAAGDGPSTGVLELEVEDLVAQVSLSGVGVVPAVCLPSKSCVESTYSLEEDRCIETTSPDGASCDPQSLCLEQGQCRAGECLGVARRCDDGDPCTDDACSLTEGCIKSPHQCPPATEVCMVATCISGMGCAVVPAPNLELCGSADCVSVAVCLEGKCETQPTPDGFPCAPAIACLPQAVCRAQKCEVVNEAEWIPDWSAPLPRVPIGDVVAQGNFTFYSSCVGPVLDGGSADASVLDAGNGRDAGDGQDAGDAGSSDGGDAGRPLVCGLTSLTGNGFERFTVPYDDDLPRAPWATVTAGVVLRSDAGLGLFSAMTGTQVSSVAFDGARTQLVVRQDRFMFSRDGVLSFVRFDGGVEPLISLESDGGLAFGKYLYASGSDSGVLHRVLVLPDGGVLREQLMLPEASESLAVSGEVAVLGGLTSVLDDGGLARFDWSDAGERVVLGARTLVSDTVADVFYERCDGGCEERVRAFDLFTGRALWDARVFPATTPTRTLQAVLIQATPGATAVLVRNEPDAGPRTYLELFAEGERVGLCRLPVTSGAVEQSVFTSNAMVVTVRRPDGGVTLESYPLKGLPVTRVGWTTTHGADGTRTDRR